MNDAGKQKKEFMKELGEIRQRMAELNRSAAQNRLAEEELRKSEERYRNLVELSPDMIALHSRGKYVYVNPAGINMLGASGPEDLIGKPTSEIIHPDYTELVKERIRQMMQGKPVPLVEEKYIRLDGKIVDVEVAAAPIPSQSEPMVQVIARDITERKRMEAALHRSKEESQRLAEEKAVMAEIGRIISSTLNVEEVYERFAQEVGKLILFDRIVVNLNNLEEKSVMQAYVSGLDMEGRRIGDLLPLEGSTNEEVMRTRLGLILHPETTEELEGRFPTLVSYFQQGIRSMMSVPLISRGAVIGALHFRSKKPKAYTDQGLRISEQIADQIAGAIANAQLYNELRRAEEGLQESEQKLMTILQGSPIPAFVIGKDHRVMYWNKALKEMSGIESADMIGTSLHWKAFYREKRPCMADLLADEVVDMIPQWYAGKYTKSKFAEGAYEAIDFFPALGEEGKWLRITAAPIRDSRGSLIGAIETLEDITESKRAEEARRKSEEEAKSLAQENAIVAEIGRIISSTLDIEEVYERFAHEVQKLIPVDRCVFTTINSEEQTATTSYASGLEIPSRLPGEVFPLAGSATEMAKQAKSGLVIPTEDENEVTAQVPGLLPVFRAGIRSVMMIPLISRDQVIGVLNLQSIKPKAYSEKELRIAERIGHQIAGAIANAQLFQERKRMEDALRESEERYRVLVEVASETVLLRRSDGKIVYANPAALKLLRAAKREDLVGRDYLEFVHPDDRDESVRRIRRGMKEGWAAPQREHRLVTLDGQVIDVESTGLALIYQGERHILGVFHDITERKKAEKEKVALQEQLQHSQKMEAIGRLAGGIAHDFNNLLTVINSNSQLGLMELREWDPLREKLDSIQKAGERAANLTRQLLAFSRRQVVEMRVIDLNALLQDLGKMLLRVIGEDIEMKIVPGNNLGRVKADPGQIEQAILNLVVNARDAMPSGGKLTIETANMELDQEYSNSHLGVKPGRYVVLSVNDTGVGMVPEVREHIFEPFFTTKEKGKGTGLGLSTVYGVVKQSGGNIWVYSEPGHGTTFKVYLPQVDEPLEEARKKGVREKLPGGSETILVVEDEEEVRRLAVAILKKQGYRILEAAHGGDAFLICEQEKGRIQLLLTDIVMPEVNGPELARRLRYFYPEMRVLFMSGYTDGAILQQGMLDKEMFFLQKPFSVEGLVSKVREVLDS
jgi:PAS domain S-box-containing protein